MFNILFQISDLSLFLLLGGASIIISVISVLFVTRYIPITLRYSENPVLGNMGSLISIIYGVLSGLIALYLINTISSTTMSVQHEASAIANIHRDSQWLKDPARLNINKALKGYLEKVINIEWPEMRRGDVVSADGDFDINAMSAELSKYPVETSSEKFIMPELLSEVKALYNARQERIAASYSELGPEIWIVIIIGTILTLVINYLFGMHLYLHLITVSAVTLMAFSMLFLLITLDRPFQGEFVIEADAFKPLLAIIEKTS